MWLSIATSTSILMFQLLLRADYCLCICIDTTNILLIIGFSSSFSSIIFSMFSPAIHCFKGVALCRFLRD